jgi:hypothetical protein
MSEATSGVFLPGSGPAYRFAHAGYGFDVLSGHSGRCAAPNPESKYFVPFLDSGFALARAPE